MTQLFGEVSGTSGTEVCMPGCWLIDKHHVMTFFHTIPMSIFCEILKFTYSKNRHQPRDLC